MEDLSRMKEILYLMRNIILEKVPDLLPFRKNVSKPFEEDSACIGFFCHATGEGKH